jgi:DNA-binding response OmpR family regulator
MLVYLSDVYIIIMTAKGQEFDRDRGNDIGGDIYMKKPFASDEILKKSCENLGIEA